MSHPAASAITIGTWNVRKSVGQGDPCYDAIARKLTDIHADI